MAAFLGATAAPTATPSPETTGPPPEGDFSRVMFLHHSCGANLIEQGGVRQLLTDLGYEFYDHGYNDYTPPQEDENATEDGEAEAESPGENGKAAAESMVADKERR